jgi:ketosteroid isomerase-like protein
MTHQNAKRLEEFLRAYADRDAERIGAALNENAVWHVGGTHRFSGDYRGRDAILEYFDRIGAETTSTLRLDPIELMANEERGAAFLRVTADREGHRLDVTMAEAFHFDDQGRIREFWAHSTDQEAIDKFWSQEDQ